MSRSLIEALSEVDLEPGRTYRCLVNGKSVELRVGDQIPTELLPAPLNQADIMLDPWVELPAPSGGRIVKAHPGKLELPDPPYDESDLCGMLDPWVELPTPKPIGTVLARFAPPLPPDIPEIPAEDEAL